VGKYLKSLHFSAGSEGLLPKRKKRPNSHAKLGNFIQTVQLQINLFKKIFQH
jgi:hypothetical protein